jgi:Glycosyltransferase (GlcNAc)
MYRGEYYSTQSDAHVTFTQNWDMDIISQMEATNDEMAVLTTYLTDVQGSIDNNGHSLRDTRPIMCNTAYEGGEEGMHLRHGSQPEKLPSIHGMPQLQPWWAAGYSFSRGHFVVNVPYDLYQPMIFQGEEMSIGIRGFTVGYDFFAPERSVCFHHYAVGKNAAIRNKVHHFWENDSAYSGTAKKAMKRLLGIVHMNPEVNPDKWDHTDEILYGLGGVRTPEKFYETFGINVAEKTTENHLCRFVDGDTGKMHKMFMKHLRKDGMGIDYAHITYRFTDPFPGQK